MRIGASLAIALIVACSSQAPRTAIDTALHAELVRLAREDQAAREGFSAAAVSGDAEYGRRLRAGDLTRTERLKQIVAARGWPTVALVGREGVDAAWLLVQHSPDSAWQRQLLPVLERAAHAGDISRANVALLTGKVLVQSGQPQRYGSSFSIIDGRLVAYPIEDEVNVDARRAAAGLPPMAEYARTLSELHRLPVEWPRRRK